MIDYNIVKLKNLIIRVDKRAQAYLNFDGQEVLFSPSAFRDDITGYIRLREDGTVLVMPNWRMGKVEIDGNTYTITLD